jgi:hypothetical protein
MKKKLNKIIMFFSWFKCKVRKSERCKLRDCLKDMERAGTYDCIPF